MIEVLDTGYEAIIAITIANVLAQLLKVFLDWGKRGEMNISLLFSTGGMPSSHSSTVTALATSIGLISGWDSPLFAISVCFAGITMYDAAGLRRSASLQARALNHVIRELFAPDHKLNVNKLKEFLGHTPREVIAGALLGIAVSLLARLWLLQVHGS